MATQVQNPFDTQQPNATNQNIQGGTQPMNTGSTANTGFQQFNPLPNLTPQTYTAQTSQVNAPNETVQGQVNSILATDSPLMQRARTLATQQMNQRGLVNSSMAQGAGVAAMTDRALPIAQQDAQTYSQRALVNQDAINQQNQFNTGQTNQLFQFGQDVAARFGMQRDQQQFQGSQAALDRAQQEKLQQNQFGFQSQQSALDRTFQGQQNQLQRDMQLRVAQLQESGASARQAQEIASREALVRLEQAGINNRFDQELAFKSSQFNAEQINLERRQIIDNNSQLERLNLQINANNQNIPTSFAANISNTTMAGVNAVMADPKMSANAKRAAITNLTNYANAQIGWAEKFYNTAIPRLPGQPA